MRFTAALARLGFAVQLRFSMLFRLKVEGVRLKEKPKWSDLPDPHQPFNFNPNNLCFRVVLKRNWWPWAVYEARRAGSPVAATLLDPFVQRLPGDAEHGGGPGLVAFGHPQGLLHQYFTGLIQGGEGFGVLP